MRLSNATLIVLVVVAGCAKPSQEATPTPEISKAEIPSLATMAGMYSYMADAATFTRCDTDVRYPVAMEGESVALERAYLAAGLEPGAALLVTVQGSFKPRPDMAGVDREHLVVENFDAIWPDETCEKLGVETPLKNTYWKLVELNGAPIVAQENQREVHLMLRVDGPDARGFAGCNAFGASYNVDGTDLHFTEILATKSACPYLDEEIAYLAALESVTRYRILGETLVLSNGATRVARFRAVYF
jgi:copper homeostasis protein (lipoprotein)